MQVDLVYLQSNSPKIHCKCAPQRKVANISSKTHIYRVQGRLRSSMLVPPKRSSSVLAMICSKSVSICNHSRARLLDSSRNDVLKGVCKFHAFVRRTPWTQCVTPDTVEMYVWCEAFHTQVVYVYLQWFRRKSLFEFVLQPQVAKCSVKTPILGFKVVQGNRCCYH